MRAYVVGLSITPMAKFISINLQDGTVILYETLTNITWRSEVMKGNHTGIALTTSNYIHELSNEGTE